MDSQTKFTVFTADGCYYGNYSRHVQGAALQQVIDVGVHEFGDPYVAWAPEWPVFYGGTKMAEQLHAESIAAGRTITLIDGKYVPQGVEAGKPIEEAMQGVNAFFKAKALSDAPADRQEQPERLFAPLPKPEPKADRWAGFIVHKDNSPRLPEVEQHKLASLGSMSHQLGSAWKK